MRRRNWLLFLFVVFIWGFNWTAMKVGLNFAAPTTFVLHRFVASAALMAPVVFVLRKKIPRDSDSIRKLLLYCLSYILQVMAATIGLVGESSGIGAVLTFTQPLFVFCLAIPFLKERITAVRLLGVMIGFLGVVIFSVDKINSFMFGSTVILTLGAFLWAASTVYYKKYLSHIDPFVTLFFQIFVGVIPLAFLSLFTNSFNFPIETAYIWAILYSSVGALVVGWAVWLFLLKQEEATVLSVSSFIIPVVALFFGWQLLRENIDMKSMLGTALILVGVGLVNLKSQQKKKINNG